MNQFFVAPMLAGMLLLLLSGSAAAQEVASCIASHEAAQRARQRGELRAARTHLEACDRDTCPSPIQRDCAQWQVEVVAALPTVVLSVVASDGTPPVGSTIRLDGERLPQASLGKALELDPGEHVLSARSSDGQEATRRFVALAGTRNQLVELRLPARAKAAAEQSAALPVAFWVAGSAAVVGAAGFAILGSIGMADEKDLRSRCAGSCAQDDVDRVHRTYLAADLFALMGIAGAATTMVIGIVHLSEPGTQTPASAVRVGVGPAGGQASLSF